MRVGKSPNEPRLQTILRIRISYRFHTDFEVGDETFATMPDPRPKACFISAQGNALGGRGQFPLQAEGLVYMSDMPQSLSQVILHIIFSTKDRRPWLDPAIRPVSISDEAASHGVETYQQKRGAPVIKQDHVI
jgi:hypothetical protein